MLRKVYLLLISFLLFFLSNTSFAQIVSGAKWSFSVEQTKDETVLVFKADIKEKFHIYSQFLSSSDGPLPTVFEFASNKNYELEGKVEEEKGHEIFDEAFQMKLLTFEGTAIFRQKIRILTKEKFEITGKLSFMACDNRMCLPPEEVPYTFNLNNK